jgi:hypothetical protein
VAPSPSRSCATQRASSSRPRRSWSHRPRERSSSILHPRAIGPASKVHRPSARLSLPPGKPPIPAIGTRGEPKTRDRPLPPLESKRGPVGCGSAVASPAPATGFDPGKSCLHDHRSPANRHGLSLRGGSRAASKRGSKLDGSRCSRGAQHGCSAWGRGLRMSSATGPEPGGRRSC